MPRAENRRGLRRQMIHHPPEDNLFTKSFWILLVLIIIYMACTRGWEDTSQVGMTEDDGNLDGTIRMLQYEGNRQRIALESLRRFAKKDKENVAILARKGIFDYMEVLCRTPDETCAIFNNYVMDELTPKQRSLFEPPVPSLEEFMSLGITEIWKGLQEAKDPIALFKSRVDRALERRSKGRVGKKDMPTAGMVEEDRAEKTIDEGFVDGLISLLPYEGDAQRIGLESLRTFAKKNKDNVAILARRGIFEYYELLCRSPDETCGMLMDYLRDGLSPSQRNLFDNLVLEKREYASLGLSEIFKALKGTADPRAIFKAKLGQALKRHSENRDEL